MGRALLAYIPRMNMRGSSSSANSMRGGASISMQTCHGAFGARFAGRDAVGADCFTEMSFEFFEEGF